MMQHEHPLLVENIGQIRRILLPPVWHRTSDSSVEGPVFLQKWQAVPDVSFSFFYRGQPVSDASAAEFHKCLSLPPHEVSLDEFENLGSAMGNCAFKKAFELRRAFTTRLKERVVLFVEGLWLNSNSISIQVFVDASGDGRVIQELHLVAPVEKFEDYREMSEGIFDTLEWID